MKKLFNNFYTIILIFALMFISCLSNITYANSSSTVSSTTENSTQSDLSSEDWKIVVDDNEKSSDEFGFIQKNLASSNLSDDGHFLLIIGIILIVLSVAGVTYFSIRLYKTSKNLSPARRKYTGNRYK